MLAAAAAMVAAGFIASLVANYPGHFTPDGIWQLAQGRSGRFNFWHPPVMAWLLGLADRILPGAWPFVVFDTTLFYGAMLAIFALEPRPRAIALPILAAWMISPVAFNYQGIVLKDVLFADAALAGFAALGWAGRLWARPVARGALLVLAFALLTLAALTRQNGLLTPLFAAGALAAMILQAPPGAARRGRRAGAMAWAVLALALVAAADAAVTAALEARSDHQPENAKHIKVQQAFDMAGMLNLDPSLRTPVVSAEQPALDRFLRVEAAPHYRPATIEALFARPNAKAMMMPPGDALGRQWMRTIASRPGLYLSARALVFRATLLTTNDDECPMVFTGIDGGDPRFLPQSGLHPRSSDQDEWDDEYARAFIGTPLFSHLFYLTLLISGIVVGCLRWRAGDRSAAQIATLALGVSTLALTLSYFVISVACDYRYLYFLDVGAMGVVLREAAARWPRPRTP